MIEEEVPQSEEKKIPLFLHITYYIVLVVGIVGFFFFWNGSRSWFDRGFWKELQKAASTTAPYSNKNE